jgi:hypothetical protein
MRKFLRVLLVVTVLLLGTMKVAHASSFVNLDVKNNGALIYSGTIPLSSIPSDDNVLSVIEQADALSPDFDISNIVHYSFGDYLKCITVSGTNELCNNWLYKVNGDSPAVGMGSYVLSGGENVLLYFGDDVTATESVTGGGPLTTGYVPPPALNPSTLTPTMSLYSPSPAPATIVFPTSTPEPKSDVLSPSPTTSLILIPKPKTKEKNLSATGKVNTATTVNALSDTAVKIPPVRKSWFVKLLEYIF